MTSRLARYLGAAALLGVGIVHLQQYLGAHYSAIPTIGTLFALNFASALVIAAGLVSPIERVFPQRGRLLHSLLALGGIGVAVGSLVALVISEHTPLFGFMESGYRGAIVVAIALEVAATVLLGGFLLGQRGARRERREIAAAEPA
jgi:hypothetical protein